MRVVITTALVFFKSKEVKTVKNYSTHSMEDVIDKKHIEGWRLADSRYKTPKSDPKADEQLIKKTIEANEIYSRAKEHILNAQRKQVGYGLDKYPEPLNADTWSAIETIDHIIEESVDKLHYLCMLRIKLEQEASDVTSGLFKRHIEGLIDERIKRALDSKSDTFHVSEPAEISITGAFEKGYTAVANSAAEVFKNIEETSKSNKVKRKP